MVQTAGLAHEIGSLIIPMDYANFADHWKPLLGAKALSGLLRPDGQRTLDYPRLPLAAFLCGGRK